MAYDPCASGPQSWGRQGTAAQLCLWGQAALRQRACLWRPPRIKWTLRIIKAYLKHNIFQNKLSCAGFYRWACSALEANIRNVHGSETSPFLSSRIFKNAKPVRPAATVGDKIPPFGEKKSHGTIARVSFLWKSDFWTTRVRAEQLTEYC